MSAQTNSDVTKCCGVCAADGCRDISISSRFQAATRRGARPQCSRPLVPIEHGPLGHESGQRLVTEISLHHDVAEMFTVEKNRCILAVESVI
jgi:hypothetical protein